MIKRVLFSAAWAAVAWLAAAHALGGYAESIYAARVAAGGDRAFNDIGFVWLAATVGFGLLVFAVGLAGLLPGTKRS